jgi:hypothetical protein
MRLDQFINETRSNLNIGTDSRDRTDAYIGTFFHHSPHDQKKIKELRDNVKILNTVSGSAKYYVKLQGRMGRDNPNADMFKRSKSSAYPFGGHRYQCIPLPLAQFADAYIYERY